MNRRGMTLIELLVTLTIVGILANIAVPALGGLRRRADAARVITDLRTVRLAALDHFVGSGAYPPTGPWGTVPPTLAPSLPQGFEFAFRGVEYRWESWPLPGGLPGNPSQTVLLCLTVRSPDLEFLAALRGLYKGEVAFGSSTEITFVLD